MFPPRTILALFIGWSVGQLLFHGCNQRPQLLVKYFCWFAHSFESSWLCQEVSRISSVEMYHPFCQGLMICPLICMVHLPEFGLKNADGRMGHPTFFAVRRSGLEPNFFSKCTHAHVRQGGGIYTCWTLRSRKLSVFAVCQGVGVCTFTGTPMSPTHTHTHIHTHMSKNHWNRFFDTQMYRKIVEYGGVQHASTINSPINACSTRGFRCCGGSTWDAWRMGTPTLDVRVPSAPWDPGPVG